MHAHCAFGCVVGGSGRFRCSAGAGIQGIVALTLGSAEPRSLGDFRAGVVMHASFSMASSPHFATFRAQPHRPPAPILFCAKVSPAACRAFAFCGAAAVGGSVTAALTPHCRDWPLTTRRYV